jgi:hypothetical protein
MDTAVGGAEVWLVVAKKGHKPLIPHEKNCFFSCDDARLNRPFIHVKWATHSELDVTHIHFPRNSGHFQSGFGGKAYYVG